jgi:hypothetical protein
LYISSFAGYLPVFSWVLIDKWLIINTIHFSGLLAFSGNFHGVVLLLWACGGLWMM